MNSIAEVPGSLVLASTSPRRKELLESAGARFTLAAPDIDETFSSQLSIEENLPLIARKKALAVHAKCPGVWVLACDTIVVVRSEDRGLGSGQRFGPDLVLGKPLDHMEASTMLKLLSGTDHRVLSAFSLLDPSGREKAGELVTTIVSFVPLTDRQIARYLMTGQAADKAGAYGIQGDAASFVRSVSGSYTNIVGLPLAEVCDALRRFSVGGVE